MTFWSVLENLLIGPLKLVFEVIFYVANSFIGHPGYAIIFLSLVMNILVLPLYRRADAMQEAARDTDLRLSRGVTHIKKTFSGDEQMMILQTYYRQNNYKPTDALNGSVSLLLEIPFFMAAYQFLSHLDILDGVSLGPIQDLGAPDGLLVFCGLTFNFLPILMTLVNVISSALYLKGFPLKTKIQLYGMALFFLVFLYKSPACLVFYWTLNNVFSLVKTIFYKLKNPQAVLRVLTTALGALFVIYGGALYETNSLKRRLFLIAIGIALLLPMLSHLISRFAKKERVQKEYKPNKRIFVLGGLLLTVLIGVLIPSAFIASSPQEYVDVSYYFSPLWYIVSAASMAAGFFLVWFGVFYWLANPKWKVIFDRAIWVLSGVVLVNYMFFGTNLGVISSTLKYEGGVGFDILAQLINFAVILAVAAVLTLVIVRWKRIAAGVLALVTVALGGMAAVNIVTINKSLDMITTSEEALAIPSFNLSKEGKNVIVIMLDRAMNAYIPYLFKEKPELIAQFDGFTRYTNVISFGPVTNIGTPALLGGYEYTPVEMNKRDDELLVDKHNEALKVVPTVFADNGYDVTLIDPVYAGYQWIPDLSVFDDTPEIDAYLAQGKFASPEQKQAVIDANLRNFFCLGVMKTVPLFMQSTVYNEGGYNQVVSRDGESFVYGEQKMYGLSQATGIRSSFMEGYDALRNIKAMTSITNDSSNNYMLMTNNLTHEPMLLQTPDYVPAQNVDNTEYDAANADRFDVDGKKLVMKTQEHMIHYHANMAAMLQLGEYFDYLREMGVYDNTRIILVSDHARHTRQVKELIQNKKSNASYYDANLFYPLLMVKDFNATGFTESDEFMTNADVPTLSFEGLVENPVNPFTGKEINSDEKTAHDQYISTSYEWKVESNQGTTFVPGGWVSVKDNIWDKKNWNYNHAYEVRTDYEP